VLSAETNEIRSANHLELPSSHIFSPGLRPVSSYLLCTNLQPLKSGLSEGFKPQGLGCLDHLIIGYCGFFEYNNRLGNNVQRNNNYLSAHLSVTMSRIARLIQYNNRRGRERFLYDFVTLEICAEKRAGLHVQFNLFLSDLNRSWSVSRNINKIPQYPFSWK
jgi:hypothetical protein